MVLLDANIFLRYLVAPNTPELERQHQASTCLFEALAADTTAASVSEAVLAEVFFVLTSPKTYDITPPDAVSMVRPLLTLRGLKVVNREQIDLALDLLSPHPALGFDDCVLAARSVLTKYPVCSFDHHFDRLEGLRRVEPDDQPLAA